MEKLGHKPISFQRPHQHRILQADDEKEEPKLYKYKVERIRAEMRKQDIENYRHEVRLERLIELQNTWLHEETTR